MPYFSVIVRTYNSVRTVKECLDAIRNSTYSDYELILVDSSSKDGTPAVARALADKFIEVQEGTLVSEAFKVGVRSSEGEVVVNVDSDAIVAKDSLGKIFDYLSAHPDVDAITGMVARDLPYRDFFSQYKNIYMYYVFSRLPERVSFLYGSIFAVRKQEGILNDYNFKRAEDTALGQYLFSIGKRIDFLKDLQVIHLKKHTFKSLIINDFRIPFYWAKIFLKYKGWHQMGKTGAVFSHAGGWQLVSIALAVFVILLCIGYIFALPVATLLGLLFLAWIIINLNFLKFAFKERGMDFLGKALVVTFLDNITMALGILCGFLSNQKQAP